MGSFRRVKSVVGRLNSLFTLLIVMVIGSAAPSLAQDDASEPEEPLQKYCNDVIASGGKIEGILREAPSGKLFFSPAGNPLVRAPVTNAEEISKNAVDISVAGLAETEELCGLKIRPETLTLSSVAEYKRIKGDLDPTEFRPVHKAFKAIEDASSSGLQDPPMAAAMSPEDQAEQIVSLTTGEFKVAKNYVECRSNNPPTECDFLLNTFTKTIANRKQSSLKTVYGRDDVYPRATYRHIWQNACGSIGLRRVLEPKPHCSGVLISKDLILTAQHCLQPNEYTRNLRVIFDYDDNPCRRGGQEKEFKVENKPFAKGSSFEVEGAGELDFLVLRATPDGAGKLPGDYKEFRQQCLGTYGLRRDDPIYIVGHPGRRPRIVHDNAWVFFAFEINRAEYNWLLTAVANEFRGKEQREDEIANFEKSYNTKKTDTEGNDVYYHYAKRWKWQPTIGADSDTFHGNSGGPAFDKLNHRVIGLLIHGESDDKKPWRAGWESHEAILPMSQIIQQIDDKRGGRNWQVQHGVCVWGDDNDPDQLAVRNNQNHTKFCTELCKVK